VGFTPREGSTPSSGTKCLNKNAIALNGSFDLNFYRQMVRNGFEAPSALQPIRRWTTTPQIYLKTVDERIDGLTE
jgi:hypothetical protein